MIPRTAIALVVLVSSAYQLAMGADSQYGPPGTGSTSSQSGTAPGSSRSPNLPTQGGATGNDTVQGRSAADSSAAASFQSLDSDRDGRISRAELQAASGPKRNFEQMDSNGDGQISFAEWQAAQSGSGAAGVTGSSRAIPEGGAERSGSPAY